MARKIVKKIGTVKKNIFKKILVKSLLILLLVAVVYFSAKFLVAASVNGQLVSRMTVIKELENQNGKAVLDTVILKTLINQEAKKRKVTVTQKELDAEIQKIEANVASQGSTLDQLLAQQGMKKEDLNEELKIQLLATKMAGSDVTVSEKEIDDYVVAQSEQLAALNPDEEISRDEIKEQLKQQKLQQKIQTFVSDLKTKAKIKYFISY